MIQQRFYIEGTRKISLMHYQCHYQMQVPCLPKPKQQEAVNNLSLIYMGWNAISGILCTCNTTVLSTPCKLTQISLCQCDPCKTGKPFSSMKETNKMRTVGKLRQIKHNFHCSIRLGPAQVCAYHNHMILSGLCVFMVKATI